MGWTQCQWDNPDNNFEWTTETLDESGLNENKLQQKFVHSLADSMYIPAELSVPTLSGPSCLPLHVTSFPVSNTNYMLRTRAAVRCHVVLIATLFWYYPG